MQVTPDVLIVPSDLRFFIKVCLIPGIYNSSQIFFFAMFNVIIVIE